MRVSSGCGRTAKVGDNYAMWPETEKIAGLRHLQLPSFAKGVKFFSKNAIFSLSHYAPLLKGKTDV